MHADVELALCRLSNNDDLDFLGALNSILPHDIRHVVVLGADSFHMVRKIKEGISSVRVLQLESAPWALDFLSLERLFNFFAPLTCHILVKSLFRALRQQVAPGHLGICSGFEIHAYIGVIRLPVNIHIKCVVWVRIENLVHTHRVLTEVGRSVIHAEIIRLEVPLTH